MNKKSNIRKTPTARSRTIPQIVAVVHAQRGLVSYVAKALKVPTITVYQWRDRIPEVKAAFEQAREDTIDLAENCLIRNIRNGDTPANTFYLKTQGRGRGYQEVQKMSIDGTLGTKNLTDEELDAALARFNKA